MKVFFTRIIGLIILLCVAPYIASAQQNLPVCGTNDSLSASRLVKFARVKDLTRARTAGEQKLEYRLALDINYKTYQLYGGDKALITRRAVQFINQASAIFERDINVKLTITSILIWDKPEPYALDEDFQYFSNVQNYWLFNRTDERDAVVSLSSRDGWFYGGYRMCSSNFPRPEMPDLSVDLLCHELGHTLGSPHTHNCSWPGGPIDRCTALEGASAECEEGYQETVNGSIMSYCRSVLRFHPLCQNLMRNYAEGNMDENFKLTAIQENPNAPDSLTVYEDDAQKASHTPSFRWKTPFGVNQYRFQIAWDAAFTDIVEDTLIAQSHFTSAGQGEGNYFARVLSDQIPKAALWSKTLPFSIAPFDEKSSAPLLLQVSWKNDGFLAGIFQKYEGIESFQIEVADKNQTDGVVFHDFPVTNQKIQHFKIIIRPNGSERYAVRLRVKQNNEWSQWSDAAYFLPPWNSTLWSATDLSHAAAKPIIAVSTYISSLHTGFRQSIEIASDRAFKQVVFKDSIALSEMNAAFTNKGVFQPILNENQSYFGRTRVQYMPGIFTNWKNFEIKTNWNDSRFEFLGLVSKNLLSTTNAYGFLKNRFYNVGDKLYVYETNNGYYTTKDLKTWEASTIATTAGKSPNAINFFGASKGGDVFAMSFNNVMLKRDVNGNYESSFANEKFSAGEMAPLVLTTSAGIFFKTSDRGVGRFLNGAWTFYGQEVLGNSHVICVAADAENQVWTVTEDGLLYSFQDNKWTFRTQLSNAQGLAGIAFDSGQNLYAYGEWGVSRLNKVTLAWEAVFSLSGYFIRNVIFDKTNQMWAAAYGAPEQHFEPHALIRFKDQKRTIYSDGMNMLKEPFDITIFNDKLLMLTTGGEVYSFQESQFQRFQPEPSYNAGDEITLTLTTNSTFGKNNETRFILRNTSNNATVKLTGTNVADNTYTFKIPIDIKGGTYQLKTATTEPEVTSNESVAFKINQSPAYNLPTEVTLMQNVPNPVGASTEIAFFLPEEGQTTLTLYNVRGQKIRSLANGKYPAGWHIAGLDGQHLAAGVYIYQLKVGNLTKTLKMVR
ncbi:M12 family metallo-peptidase [Dyadobacter sp. LJ53]|uniref:zinc-dependent metalloprotease n=1 Tax=Dyadobacter chenwenxiniae TaxID=2906456 RepID=UPI001F27EE1E|nr:zinc-dependent metalloprotease [Dyadobacter chenwenxiniae]MCF0048874.1 M12 family metallo-peptidase [Dyadobacter chenwenxiniae]